MTTKIDVLLFEPKYPENAGFIARSMLAFGFRKLVLINPQFSLHDNSLAYKTSSGANKILEKAVIVSSLQEAAAASHRIIGFSRRKHNSPTQHKRINNWLEELQSIPNDLNIESIPKLVEIHRLP